MSVPRRLVVSGRSIYRRDALLYQAQPEAFDTPLCVTAPHERIFRTALLFLCLALLAYGLLF